MDISTQKAIYGASISQALRIGEMTSLVDRSSEDGVMGVEAMLRGGLLIAVAAFESLNSSIATALLANYIRSEQIKTVAELSRIPRIRCFYDVNSVKEVSSNIASTSSIDYQSLVDSVRRKTYNRIDRIQEMLDFYSIDISSDISFLAKGYGERPEGLSADEFIKEFGLFIDRRNNIAHRGDWLDGLNMYAPFPIGDFNRMVLAVDEVAKMIIKKVEDTSILDLRVDNL